jgi:hypothetical protein
VTAVVLGQSLIVRKLAGSRPAKLLINEADWITRFVIGHENSPWHKKVEFQL